MENTMAALPYEIAWDPRSSRLTFTLRGRWDHQIMTQWDNLQRNALTKVPPTGWTILANLVEYLPQSEDIQKGHEALMALSVQRGMVLAAVVMSESVAAMQIKRLSGQAHADNRIVIVTSVAEAERVLARAVPSTPIAWAS
jgi:hypothetical protein